MPEIVNHPYKVENQAVK